MGGPDVSSSFVVVSKVLQNNDNDERASNEETARGRTTEGRPKDDQSVTLRLDASPELLALLRSLVEAVSLAKTTAPEPTAAPAPIVHRDVKPANVPAPLPLNPANYAGPIQPEPDPSSELAETRVRMKRLLRDAGRGDQAIEDDMMKAFHVAPDVLRGAVQSVEKKVALGKPATDPPAYLWSLIRAHNALDGCAGNWREFDAAIGKLKPARSSSASAPKDDGYVSPSAGPSLVIDSYSSREEILARVAARKAAEAAGAKS